MSNKLSHQPAFDPQDLERLLILRQRAGDVDGMTALFEEDAVIDSADGTFVRGKEAIRAFFTEQVKSGKKYAMGEQRAALVAGELALTSTKLPDGSITSEVARQQGDGSWLWIIDRYAVT